MTEGWTGGSDAESELSRRIEELASRAAADDGDAAPLAASSGDGGSAVRDDISALRSDVAELGRTLTTRLSSFEAGGADTGSLEARMATLEDSLGVVAERLEALTRDDATVTGERLEALSRDVGALTTALASGQQELRGLVAAGGGGGGGGGGGDLTAVVDAQQRAADAVIGRVDQTVGGLSTSVREAIDAFARSVERSLTALGGSVGAALAEARDAHHDHLDEVASALDAPLQRMAVLYNDLAAKVDAAASGGGGGVGREEFAALVGGLQQLGGVQAQVARAVEELRQSGSQDLSGAIDALRQATAAELGKLRAETLAVLSSGQDRTVNILEEADRLTGSRLVELRRAFEKSGKSTDTLADKMGEIVTASAETAAVLGRLDESWTDISTQTVEEVHAAATEELTKFRESTRKELDALKSALKDTASSVVTARSEIDQGTRLLVAAGQSLLQYLAERDAVLEEERTRVFREVLDEFGKGLNAKSRKHLTDRIDEALERHRDARDADRWRRKAEKPAPTPLLIAPDEPPATLKRDRSKIEPDGPQTGPITPVAAKPAAKAAATAPVPTPVVADGSAEPGHPVPVSTGADRPVVRKAAAAAAQAAQRAKASTGATPAKKAPAKKAAAKAPAKKAVAKKAPAKKASAKAPARKRATVDGVPEVGSARDALDAATGDIDTAIDLTAAAADAQAAIDAFTEAARARPRLLGRRPRG